MNTESYTKAHQSLALYNASVRFGRVAAIGPDAIDLLHRMSTNDLLPLIGKPGAGSQTVLTTEKGRIVDLITVLSQGKDAMLMTSGGKEEEVIEWLHKFVIMEDAKFEKRSGEIAQFLLFGPKAMSLLQKFTDVKLITLENFHFLEIEIGGIPARLQKTNRIIESGWALFVDMEKMADLLAFLIPEIDGTGGTVIDDDTYDLLRIEAGIPLAPNELNGKHNPLETTLVQAVSFTKGCYIGQEVIARLDTYDKVQRHLMGITIERTFQNTPLPVPVTNAEGEHIGEMTSFAFSPAMEKWVGLAFIKSAFAIPEMQAGIGEEKIAATLVKLPFEL